MLPPCIVYVEWHVWEIQEKEVVFVFIFKMQPASVYAGMWE